MRSQRSAVPSLLGLDLDMPRSTAPHDRWEELSCLVRCVPGWVLDAFALLELGSAGATWDWEPLYLEDGTVIRKHDGTDEPVLVMTQQAVRLSLREVAARLQPTRTVAEVKAGIREALLDVGLALGARR